jgi:spore maturation protein CgeB
MRVVLYTHSLASDWNHGNAHFLRGVLSELEARGHTTLALEPADGWSRTNLLDDAGQSALDRFHTDFPELTTQTYDARTNHERLLEGAEVVLVHEWTDPALVAHIGQLKRAGGPFTLLFHDTHHRGVSEEHAIATLPLADYDAVLAFGQTLTDRYARLGWSRQVFTWHEAADTSRFTPRPEIEKTHDLIWIGNWGDGERERELDEFLIAPATQLNLTGHVHGVRYPEAALARLGRSKLHYEGWLANARAPASFAAHRMTVHVPRRPYVQALPGIPTIRMFEALACGVPVVSAPWSDSEHLFRPNQDYLSVRNGEEMTKALDKLRNDPDHAAAIAARGMETIRARHTCAHRVDELLTILAQIRNHQT